MTRRIAPASSVPMLLVGILAFGAPLAAQDGSSVLDSTPRSVFADEPIDGEPDMFCFTNCFEVGPHRRMNCVCSTNHSPFPTWVFVCIENTDGYFSYHHETVMPGDSVWTWDSSFDDEWSWITHWMYHPYGIPDDLELSVNSVSRDDQGILSANSAGTVQVQSSAGFAASQREVAMLPAVGQSWNQSIAIEPERGGMKSLSDWDGQGDNRIDRTVATHMTAGPGTMQFTQEVDRGKDGVVDHVVVLRTATGDDGSMTAEFQSFDGRGDLLSSFTATKVTAGNQAWVTTHYDNDGDGSTDQIEIESILMDGLSSTKTLMRDLGANGSVDETELTVLNYRGLRDKDQNRTHYDADGNLVFAYEDAMVPIAGGYYLETLEDAEGDGAYELRTAQLSLVGPFAGGIDTDYFGLDFGNDGTWDSLSHTSTSKMLSPGAYVEIVGTDQGFDGIVDGYVVRSESE